MYFNNVHILYYVSIFMIGLIVGKFTAWCNTRLPEKEKIFSKEFFEENKKGLKNNYIFMFIIAILYVALLYKFGLNKSGILKNLELIKFIILMPMLILAISIDINKRIIPNRLNLTILEIGLIITFIYGITNVNMAKEYIFGMITGAGIFLVIAGLGRLIAGKESMGFGDIKFMGAIGIFFGTSSIAEISLLAFLLAAVCSIVILFIRIIILKTKDEYIPFGPFLSIAAIACIFMPTNVIFDYFLLFCKIISSKLPI